MLNRYEKKLPTNKNISNTLTYIYGINYKSSIQICKKIGINHSIRMTSLSKTQLQIITQIIESEYIIEQDLKKLKKNNNKNLLEMRCYRGLRNWKGLPVRGQRTHTNSRTKKKLKYRN